MSTIIHPLGVLGVRSIVYALSSSCSQPTRERQTSVETNISVFQNVVYGPPAILVKCRSPGLIPTLPKQNLLWWSPGICLETSPPVASIAPERVRTSAGSMVRSRGKEDGRVTLSKGDKVINLGSLN